MGSTDRRHVFPRFQGENLQKNLELVGRVEELAKSRNATPAQIAIAWVLSRGNDVIPIPGTKKLKYLEQNVAALDIKLTPADLAKLEEWFAPGAAAGMRYYEHAMHRVNG
jgi:aryl-alcohol dehydrogenase-like predicted oxidoreductase